MSVAERKLAAENKHFGGPTTSIRLTAPERDTILAALRVWQGYVRRGIANAETKAIATNNGEHELLSIEGIDLLCQDLNQ